MPDINSSSNIILGEIPSKEQIEWVNLGKEMIKGSLDNLTSEAKDLVTLSSSLLAVYTAALTLFKIPDTASVSGFIILLIPIAFWLGSIYYGTSINFHDIHKVFTDSPESVKSIVTAMIRDKHSKLILCRKLFIISLALSAFVLVLTSTSLIQQELAPQEVQFIVAKDKISEFQNSSIPLEKSGGRTVAVKLIGKSASNYKIKLPVGTIVEIKSDMAKGIIYK